MIAPLTAEDVAAGFRSGVHPLDDYFARHALPNDRAGVSRCFALRPGVEKLPVVCGFYTLSMTSVQADAIRAVLRARLAVDECARGRGFGEALLVDSLTRVVGASESVGCVGVIVDAKDEGAERFCARYGFLTVEAEIWPRRMFLAIATARAAADSKARV